MIMRPGSGRRNGEQMEQEWDEQALAERRRYRHQMIAKRKRRNRRLRLIYGLIRFFGPYAAGGAALIAAAVVGVNAFFGREEAKEPQPKQENAQQQMQSAAEGASQAGTIPEGAAAGGAAQEGAEGRDPGEKLSVPVGSQNVPAKVYEAHTTASTRQLGEEIDSDYAILIDMETGEILAEKNGHTVINPASMTKILTVLVAAEHVTDLDDTFTVTLNETDYSYVNDCSNVGFLENEVVTVRDLLYGTILPSGGDAAAGLAAYVAGTREAFVDLMNKKLEELRLFDTAHFTNCVGLYDENHYCTVYDMAIILQAAMDNEICREVLSARTYTTSATAQHPDGILISNWFLRRIEDKDTGGEVLYAKTGYVTQAGSCAASYQKADNGKGYLCVTAQGDSSWKCIYDHVALYKEYSE